MKHSLQLKMGQHLSMTPQLQQAIRLLQLSSLDLKQEIQEALDSNPILELDESASFDDAENKNADADAKQAAQDSIEQTNSSEHIEQAKISDGLDMDASWEDIYSASSGNTGIMPDGELPIYQGETTQTLQTYLQWQLDLTPFSENDRSIAHAVLDSLDEYGYLTSPIEDILQSLGDDEIEVDEVEAVLKRMQQFDPIGVASRNLQESLLVQLAAYPESIPHLREARLILTDHIDKLGNRDYKLICKEAKLKEDDLKEALTLIQTLNPRPGDGISTEDTPYIIPDVTVFKADGKWKIRLNSDITPQLTINQTYAALAKKSSSQGRDEDRDYIRNHLQEAKWLIKSLEARNQTLYKVAHCIVSHQQDFFEHGEQAMKPMVLNDVAQAIDMHESTISRATTQKYMHTPRGIFELKYFFSSHVNTEQGGECSSTAIRAHIKQLVADENCEKPLSDNKLTQLLEQKGIQVARRTVAKYRESLGIASSSQRKRLF